MAKRWSTGLVNFLAANGSLRQAANGARFLIFSGSQVATANDAAVGTLLATLTKGGGAFTAETLAEWKVTLSGSAGSLAGLLLGALVRSGTAQAGAAATVTLDASASATDDDYNGMFVLITGGTGAGQYRKITDYVGSTKVATVATWSTNPDATSTFQVVAGVDLLSEAVAFATDLTTTATNVVTNVNSFISLPDLTAYSSGADLFVMAPKATGSLMNGFRLFAVGASGITATVASGGLPQTLGVDCVNGVTWQSPAVDGVIAKESTVMQGNGVATGTAGWFRVCFDSADDGLSASTSYKRVDGNVGTTDSDDCKLSSLQVQTGVPVVINTFPLSVLRTLTA